ncbi:MAG: type II toxin-antitoxin system RelE/ParE family toxin [Nitrospinae bacterium]|nr:type II toxin-antitoxin system RelE/ParE family toxin [Nitrospinota bacterium]
MAEIEWTEEAQTWLKDIFDFIANDNPSAAANVGKGDILLFQGNRVGFRDLVFASWPNLALQTDRLTAPAITSLERTPLWGERPVHATPAGTRLFLKRARVAFHSWPSGLPVPPGSLRAGCRSGRGPVSLTDQL